MDDSRLIALASETHDKYEAALDSGTFADGTQVILAALQQVASEQREETTRLLDEERRRWYAAFLECGDLEGLAPEVASKRILAHATAEQAEGKIDRDCHFELHAYLAQLEPYIQHKRECKRHTTREETHVDGQLVASRYEVQDCTCGLTALRPSVTPQEK